MHCIYIYTIMLLYKFVKIDYIAWYPEKKTHINPSPMCRFFSSQDSFSPAGPSGDQITARVVLGMIARNATCDGSIRFCLGRLVVHLVVYPMNYQLRLFDFQIFILDWLIGRSILGFYTSQVVQDIITGYSLGHNGFSDTSTSGIMGVVLRLKQF